MRNIYYYILTLLFSTFLLSCRPTEIAHDVQVTPKQSVTFASPSLKEGIPTSTTAPKIISSPTYTYSPTLTLMPTENPLAGLSGFILVDDVPDTEKLLAIYADGTHEIKLDLECHENHILPNSNKIISASGSKITEIDTITGDKELFIDLGADIIMYDPTFSPDGENLAFSYHGKIFIVDLFNNKVELIFTSPSAVYTGDRTGFCDLHYIYWADNNRLLFYAGYDLPDQILGTQNAQKYLFIDCDGRVWHEFDKNSNELQSLDKVDQFSNEFQTLLESTLHEFGKFSPDGSKFAYRNNGSLYIHWLDGSSLVREASSGAYAMFEWSFDSDYIVQTNGPNDDSGLWVMPIDPNKSPMKLFDCTRCYPCSWIQMERDN